jgi:hypothetical protein
MKYIKYTAVLFGILMILNMTVLLPVYMTGVPQRDFKISDFSVLTIFHASASDGRIWVAFTFILLDSFLALYCVYIFWKISIRLKHRNLHRLNS